MDELILVSADSHAQPPPEAWPEYLESRFHDELPSLRDEQERYAVVMGLVFDRTHTQYDVFDRDGVYRAEQWRGLYDLDVRLAEMDREGVAGEFLNNGDGRVVGMFFEAGNRTRSAEVCRAGVRAYHRWLHDVFGGHPDRLFLVGAVGTAPCADLDPALAELDWIADHGYVATAIPGKTAYPGEAPLDDPSWEPFWAACADRGLALWIHGGHGQPQGSLYEEVVNAHAQFEATGRDLDRFWEILVTQVFNGEILDMPTPRQAMWQLMFSGVFDRHPDLVLMMNEVRADWVPATLAHLDRVWAAHRDDLPAKRPPSEYWQSNCMACLSFVHKDEALRRHEIGVDTISFGRDYPHTEGTWPNTLAWLQDAFAGVPERELRAMLGENIIRLMGLDRASLAAVAAKIGPTAAAITQAPPVDPALVGHFDARGGYLKPFEGDRRIPEIDALVQADLARAARIH